MSETKRLTNADLAEIKKRAEAVRSNNWWVKYGYDESAEVNSGNGFAARNVCITQYTSDAEFIAHARQDVPALLAEVERLRADLAELICAVYEYEQDGTALMDLAERIDEDGE